MLRVFSAGFFCFVQVGSSTIPQNSLQETQQRHQHLEATVPYVAT